MPPTATPETEPSATSTSAEPTATFDPEPSATRTSTEPTATPQPPTQEPGTQGVDALLAAMTMEEKVGQLFLVFFEGSELSAPLREMIEGYHIGGVVLFSSVGNVENPAQVATMVNDIQEAAVSAGEIPLLVAVDQEGGTVARLREGVTVFPGNMALGATGSRERARQMGAITATELRALGINVNLAPVLDVNNNPANPVIGLRSFGASPDLVADLGVEVITAHREAGVIATGKHFPGHGDTDVDSHFGLPVVGGDRARLEAVELVPFRRAIEAGVDAIMTAHVELPAIEPEAGLPATLSSRVLEGLLREEMGFQSVVMTDSLGMGALSERYTTAETAAAAFSAGADILAFGADYGHSPEEQKEAYAVIFDVVRSGQGGRDRLDESVRRILTLKAKYGLLDWSPADVGAIPDRVGTAENRAVAAVIAEEAITLVRDEARLLPLALEGSLLAVVPERYSGLIEALAAHHPSTQGLTFELDPSEEEIQAALAAAAEATVVLVATWDAWRHPGQVTLVQGLADRPLAVVALGTPYDLMSFSGVPTYLATYGGIQASLDAVGRVLLGLAAPRGRLPVDLPGLYPLGHGLDGFTR